MYALHLRFPSLTLRFIQPVKSIYTTRKSGRIYKTCLHKKTNSLITWQAINWQTIVFTLPSSDHRRHLDMTTSQINFRDLLQTVETALFESSDVDVVNLAQTLQQAKPSFVNILKYKV